MSLQIDSGSSTRFSLVYLLRIWPGNQPGQTRCRLEDVTTRQSMLFDDVQELVDFLAQQVQESLLDG